MNTEPKTTPTNELVFFPSSPKKPKVKQTRIQRLVSYLVMMEAEERKSGYRRLSADLKALAKALHAIEPAMQSAAGVPEWGNHEDERTGKPLQLGTVASTYADWIEEGVEPASEHDGACQLAEMAKALRPALNALDALTFRN